MITEFFFYENVLGTAYVNQDIALDGDWKAACNIEMLACNIARQPPEVNISPLSSLFKKKKKILAQILILYGSSLPPPQDLGFAEFSFQNKGGILFKSEVAISANRSWCAQPTESAMMWRSTRHRGCFCSDKHLGQRPMHLTRKPHNHHMNKTFSHLKGTTLLYRKKTPRGSATYSKLPKVHGFIQISPVWL